MYDLIIIGGGPAGLTAAVYAIRKRLNCLLVSPDLGGKANAHWIIEGVDTFNVINGADIVRRFRNEIEYLDFARILEKVTKLEKVENRFVVTVASGKQLEARAVIFATGADAVRLKVPGADRYFLRGVGYSTVSYAPLYIDKAVALVGADVMALRGAAELAQIAKQLYLVAPTRGELDTYLGRKLQAAPNVTLFEGWQPVGVEGDTFARKLTVKSPAGEERTLDVDAIFVELGLKPHTALVADWVQVDEEGRIVVNCSGETSVPGLFAAGDVANQPAEQVLIAIGDGAKAALNAYEYLLKCEEC
ncbi:MAG: NAD(P)/FAD-dependent oxidoreductase [Chloroflexi bacterium]|nr:NAD(P)/FAD-dependent oxidoreductase [Chloroflexota bacterium]